MTIEELYAKVLSDDAEKVAFAEAAKSAEGLEGFLKEHDCDASPEEVGAFLKAKAEQRGELADEELDSVAGGCNTKKIEDVAVSVVSAGIACLYLI